MMARTPRNLALALAVAAGLVTLGAAHAVPAAGQDDADTEAKIAVALSAAPATVSADATIYDRNVDDAGNFIVLREGSNGWSCFPDAPGTPATDPMCLDQTWMTWLSALVAHEEPDITAPGFAYMLQGGDDGSNTDPFATEPVAGEEWVSSPAHVMLLMPGDLDPSIITTDHHSGHPYIMWEGTPYEHIMMPVADPAHDD
ncbi:MAG: hypothetical protein JNM64_13145 [Chloroflexia bacterium]|nr:hypothetical protein [Chloroflexia bacterium]